MVERLATEQLYKRTTRSLESCHRRVAPDSVRRRRGHELRALVEEHDEADIIIDAARR